MKYFFLLFILILVFPDSSRADSSKTHQIYSAREERSIKRKHLTLEEQERLSVCKDLLAGVDRKSFEKSLRDLEQSPSPQENLGILEAIAQTYSDIVQEQKVVGQDKKAWLYNMITLNMAYLQLAGIDAKQSEDSPLDKLIRRKLRKHLSLTIRPPQCFLFPGLRL